MSVLARHAKRRSGLWSHGDFLRLWVGQTVGELGSQVTLVALPLAAILVLHASVFEVAVLSSFELVPFLLFGLVAGVWVDRLPYRLVLISADLGRAVVLGSVPLSYALGALTLAQLYAVGFLAGTLTVFFTCAYGAYIPSLVERARLVEANSKLEVTRGVAQTAGPGAGGLIALSSAPVAILADAASFVFSGLLVATIRHREQRQPQPEKRQLMVELREGIAFVWRHPFFRPNLFGSGLASLSYGIVWSILLVYAVRSLGLHAGLIGLILAIAQAGGILGAVFARRIASTIGFGPTFITGIACAGPAALLIAVAGHATAIPLLTIGLALWSFGAMITGVIGASIRQALVPPRLYGRVLGANRTIIWGIAPLGALIGGTLAASIGLRPTFMVGSVTAAVAFLPLLFSPARQLRVLPAPRVEAQQAPEPQPVIA